MKIPLGILSEISMKVVNRKNLFFVLVSSLLFAGHASSALADNKFEFKRIDMVSMHQIQIRACEAPFSIKILDNVNASFSTGKSPSPSLSVTEKSIESKGLDEPTIVMLRSQGISELKLELSSKGSTKESFRPLLITNFLTEVENDFNPPDNISVKTLKLFEDEKNPSESSTIETGDGDAEDEDGITLRQHGFLDITSLFYLAFYGLVLAGFIFAIKFLLKKRK